MQKINCPIFNLFAILLLTLCERIDCQKSYYQNPNLRLSKCFYNELGFSKEIKLPNSIMSNNQTTTFKLQIKCATRLPHCMQPCTTEIIRNTIEYPDERPLIFDRHFTPTGFLRYGSDFYHPDEYCLIRSTKKSITVEVCRPDCTKTHVCVPKCCSADKVLDYNTNRCVYTQQTIWEPSVYKTEDLQVCGEKRANIRLHYYQSIPDCPLDTQAFFLKAVPGINVKGGVRVKFRLLLNGSVVVRDLLSKKWERPEFGQFCIDGVQNFGTQENNLGPYMGDQKNQILLVCPKQLTGTNATVNRLTTTGILYSVLLFSGTPFLLVTCLVYILLWHKQNIHGWTLFSHTLAMLLNYLGQGIANTVSRFYDSDDTGSTSCILIGITNHFFTLASFCWITIISYDLCHLFRNLKNTVGRSRGIKRFGIYMVFGWGFPFVVVLISTILDMKYGLYGDDGGECATEFILPLYGHKSCYIAEDSRPYFLFYPIGTLMLVNLVFAGITSHNIYLHNKSAQLAEKKSTKHKRMFAVWFKLFIVMGTALTSEIIVWNLKKKDETLPWFLIFPDFLSVLQAIAIFILFVCQRKILNQLKEEYPKLKPFLEAVLRLPCYEKPISRANTPARL